MLSFKKTLLSTLILSSCASYAGTMGPVCQPGDVTVPCASTAWDIGIQALYLRPTYSDNASWLGANSTTTAAGVTTESWVENEPDWAWGFKLEGSYHFNTGNDVNLNWYHLGKNTTTHTLSDSFNWGNIFIDRDVNTASLTPEWDAVNLEVGQHVDLGVFKNVRLHGGVQYAHLHNAATFVSSDTFIDPVAAAVLLSTVQFQTTYDGFGPRIGSDLVYDFNSNFAVYAKGAAALLIGKGDFTNSLTTNDPLDPDPYYASGSKTALVPELEAKLGLQYNFAVAQGDLSLDLGYMWVNYFQAQIYQNEFDDMFDSNFGFHGPYFGVKWVGSLA
ncbi:Lpg1974 family pore-forming outer membrane protein [Legionella impletisoli]|uniref:Membrane protein n=1 Tax=Legionella impletisoli TaxID=343510 RepID=A0A917NBU7_9GAMM|nr:Lpg1974 family pore-forming outer membrane protein [Legionella impletisoli]GGI87308.1 membrane protein [Legionella impletisoli]